MKTMGIKAEEFANAVTDMLQSEKDTFIEMMQNEDWDAIRDEIYEYASQAE